MQLRTVVRLLAVGRLGFGATMLLVPRPFARRVIGAAVDTPAGHRTLRALGARDLVVGTGSLAALTGRGPLAPWLWTSAACEAFDAVLLASKRLPKAYGAASVAAGAMGAGEVWIALRTR